MTAPLEASVIEHFLSLVVHQLRNALGVEAVIAAITEPSALDSIAVAIDYGGDVRGPVTWVFPTQIALELVRRLMADPDPAADQAIDGATELANILTGFASQALERHGFHHVFGGPRLHCGTLPGGITVRLATVAGPIDVILSMVRDASRTVPS